ncbi:Yos1-like protein [Myriangium duriaei CBS 260.36]|uniref:Yos1-like protein n=1 Tax=Myriangium duriaei CBS 260.36 TaxID=1168546 RepID=A0A9P4J0M3_9PEZI|nr:Yos1-like protein [Myriangium duriaei CBS 260.36]
MFFFGLGGLFYVSILLVNAIAILSEDRFLARIGWGNASPEPGFGGVQDTTSIKAKTVNLISSVRTVMRIPLIAVNTLIIVYELILG